MPGPWHVFTLALVLSGLMGSPRIAAREDRPGSASRGGAAAQEEEFWALAVLPVRAVPAGELAESPERFYGNLIAVPAAVSEVLSNRSFALDDRREPSPDIIVVAPLPALHLVEGDMVMVIGHLRPLVIDELEHDYPWFDRDWFRHRSDREPHPVLVAASVRTADGQELLGVPGAAGDIGL
jgi:hypothetical protein